MKNQQVSVYEVCEMFARKWLDVMTEYAVFEHRDARNESDFFESGFSMVAEQYGYEISITEFIQQYLMSEYILGFKKLIEMNKFLDIDECLNKENLPLPITRAQYDAA
jgi:hypothetical protein